MTVTLTITRNLFVQKKKLSNQSVLTEIVFFLVVVKPTISHKTKNVNRNLKEGETANLTCNATGYPEPTITWYREKEGKRQGEDIFYAFMNHFLYS